MARGFAKVSEEEIEEAFFYPSDLVNTKTTIPLRVGEGQWIYTSTLRVSVYIHHYSPPLRGIVVYYHSQCSKFRAQRLTVQHLSEPEKNLGMNLPSLPPQSPPRHPGMKQKKIISTSNSLRLDYRSNTLPLICT